MPLNVFRYYLGKLGNMQMLPPFVKGSNASATATLIGSSHVSINGRSTLDITGFKRNWQWSFSYRQESEYQALISAFRRLGVGPTERLRLFDPRRVNCLSGQVSTCGGEIRDATGFTASVGAPGVGTISTLPTALQNVETFVQLVAAGSGVTLLTSATAVPTISSAAWLFSSYGWGSGTWEPIIQPYDITGAALSVVPGTAIALPATCPSSPNGVIGPYFPPNNVASFAVGWMSTTAGTLDSTGWQVEHDTVSATPAPFAIGVGTPTVYVQSMTEVYPYKTFFSSDVTLQEV
jgi:hypothetical protein